jgi:diguanylate cyclase
MQEDGPFADFTSTARFVLEFLHQRFGFSLWMVTRTEGNDWIVLESEDHGYGVTKGNVFRWADSFCSHMVAGRGPFIAPNSVDIPVYAAAPIGTQVPIGAYIGVPLNDADGGLFGTLCAIDPKPQSATLSDELPLIKLMGRLISTCLAAELRLSTIDRQRELLEFKPSMSKYVGVYNHVGWNRIVAAEELRCNRYGHPATVVSIKVIAPEFKSQVAGLIVSELSRQESVAYLEDGEFREFVVLAPESNEIKGKYLRDRLSRRLSEFALHVILQSVTRDPRESLAQAVLKARQPSMC